MSLTRQMLANWLMARSAHHRQMANAYLEEAERLKKYGHYVPFDELMHYNELLDLSDNHMEYSVALALEAEYVLTHPLRYLIEEAEKWSLNSS